MKLYTLDVVMWAFAIGVAVGWSVESIYIASVEVGDVD